MFEIALWDKLRYTNFFKDTTGVKSEMLWLQMVSRSRSTSKTMLINCTHQSIQCWNCFVTNSETIWRKITQIHFFKLIEFVLLTTKKNQELIIINTPTVGIVRCLRVHYFAICYKNDNIIPTCLEWSILFSNSWSLRVQWLLVYHSIMNKRTECLKKEGNSIKNE